MRFLETEVTYISVSILHKDQKLKVKQAHLISSFNNIKETVQERKERLDGSEQNISQHPEFSSWLRSHAFAILIKEEDFYFTGPEEPELQIKNLNLLESFISAIRKIKLSSNHVISLIPGSVFPKEKQNILNALAKKYNLLVESGTFSKSEAGSILPTDIGEVTQALEVEPGMGSSLKEKDNEGIDSNSLKVLLRHAITQFQIENSNSSKSSTLPVTLRPIRQASGERRGHTAPNLSITTQNSTSSCTSNNLASPSNNSMPAAIENTISSPSSNSNSSTTESSSDLNICLFVSSGDELTLRTVLEPLMRSHLYYPVHNDNTIKLSNIQLGSDLHCKSVTFTIEPYIASDNNVRNQHNLEKISFSTSCYDGFIFAYTVQRKSSLSMMYYGIEDCLLNAKNVNSTNIGLINHRPPAQIIAVTEDDKTEIATANDKIKKLFVRGEQLRKKYEWELQIADKRSSSQENILTKYGDFLVKALQGKLNRIRRDNLEEDELLGGPKPGVLGQSRTVITSSYSSDVLGKSNKTLDISEQNIFNVLLQREQPEIDRLLEDRKIQDNLSSSLTSNRNSVNSVMHFPIFAPNPAGYPEAQPRLSRLAPVNETGVIGNSNVNCWGCGYFFSFTWLTLR